MNVNFFISFLWADINSEKQLCAAENSYTLKILGVEFSYEKPCLTKLGAKLGAISVKFKTEKSVQTEKSAQVDFD